MWCLFSQQSSLCRPNNIITLKSKFKQMQYRANEFKSILYFTNQIKKYNVPVVVLDGN